MISKPGVYASMQYIVPSKVKESEEDFGILLRELSIAGEACNFLEKAPKWKYVQHWGWHLFENGKALDSLEQFFCAVDKILIQTSHKTLRGVSDLSEDWYNDDEEERHGKHHRAIVFGFLFQISLYPEEMLGTDYIQSQLYQKSIALIAQLRQINKILEFQSRPDLIAGCQMLSLLWEAAVLEYFVTQKTMDSEPKGLPSYWSERELTQEENQALKIYPLLLIDELAREPTEDILLLSFGCAGREDQQIPTYIKNHATTHTVKIIAIDPAFSSTHPRALDSSWQAVDDKECIVAYSNRYIKDNIQFAICREGLTCSKEERAALLSYLTRALERGTKVYIGEHCSPVSEYINDIFSELKNDSILSESLVMYSEHGQGYVIEWCKDLSPEAADLIEFKKKSEIYKNADFIKEISDYRISNGLSLGWERKYIEAYKHETLEAELANLGVYVFPCMDELNTIEGL